jgi:hypothetical protein
LRLPQAWFASLDLVDCLFDNTETDALEHASPAVSLWIRVTPRFFRAFLG